MNELKHRFKASVNTVNLYSITLARSLRSLAYIGQCMIQTMQGNIAMTRASLSDCVIMCRVPTPLATVPAMVLSMVSLTPSPPYLLGLRPSSVYFRSTLRPCGLRLLQC